MQIIFTRGISGAGKSAWAKSQEQNGFFVVSRDEIRSRYCANLNKYFKDIRTDALENCITRIEFQEIAQHLAAHHDLIIDNTNLEPRYIQRYIDIFSAHGLPTTSVKIQDFPSTPAKSFYRNLRAGKHVHLRLIFRQAKLYKRPVKIEDFIEQNTWRNSPPKSR